MDSHTTLLNKIANTMKRHQAPYLPAIALSCTIALSASLTSLNRSLVQEQSQNQSIFTSFFCIEAAIIYALYMIISRMLSFFLSYIESSSSSSTLSHDRSGYIASYYYDHIIEEEDEAERKGTFQTYTMNHMFNNGHREALISSMYLGGAGAFLSLPALCFWDFSISASFILSLTLIGLFNDHTKHTEFAPNQDKQQVLLIMKRFRWSLYSAVIAVVVGIVFQDSYYRYFQNHHQYYYLYYPQQQNNNGNSTKTVVISEERPWPMMLLSFSSPLLMRMGMINPRTIAHKIIMSPSQSLEVALPISNLLAILVLCWYSPLDNIFVRPHNVQNFVPMLVLCPSCLAAILAFILRGFQNKQTLGTVVPLTCTCIIIQQIMDRRLKNPGDWALIGGIVLVLLFSLLFFLYKRKVLMFHNNGESKQHNDEDHISLLVTAAETPKTTHENLAGELKVDEFLDDQEIDDLQNDDDGKRG